MLEQRLYEEDMNQINGIDLPWDRIEGKSILITGATGLICSVLVDALIYRNEKKNANINIWVLGRNKQTIVERFEKYLERNYFHYLIQDVCNEIMIEEQVDYIIHGASKGDPLSFVKDPVGVMNANYMGMYQVLELARKNKTKKVLFISSGEVYGIQKNEINDNDEHTQSMESKNVIESNENIGFNERIGMKETDYGYVDLLNPRSCYASSKRAAETICTAYYIQYGIDVSIARPCHTYGPTMLETDNRVIGEFIRKALHHLDIVMKSEGIQERSYCYVSDTVTAILYILLLGDYNTAYNIANKNSAIKIRDLAEVLAKKADTKVVYELPEEIDKKGYSGIVHAILDPSELESLGWNPRYGIVEGIDRTMNILSSK